MSKSWTEEELIRALRQGHDKAVLFWYHAYQARLLAFIGQRVSLLQDAEELTQETFINCLRNLPQFAGHSSLWTWMCAIAKHEVGDYYRKKYAKKVLKLLPLTDWLWPNIEGGQPEAEPLAFDNELPEKLNQVWSKIGGYYQELLQQKYLDRLSVAQLAEHYGKSFKAIESDLYRARRAFKAAYQELED